MVGLGGGHNVHSDRDNHHRASSELPGYAGVVLQVGNIRRHRCETLSVKGGMLGKKVVIQRRTSTAVCNESVMN